MLGVHCCVMYCIVLYCIIKVTPSAQGWYEWGKYVRIMDNKTRKVTAAFKAY